MVQDVSILTPGSRRSQAFKSAKKMHKVCLFPVFPQQIQQTTNEIEQIESLHVFTQQELINFSLRITTALLQIYLIAASLPQFCKKVLRDECQSKPTRPRNPLPNIAMSKYLYYIYSSKKISMFLVRHVAIPVPKKS